MLIDRPWQTRAHCCGHIVADTNVSPFARTRNIWCGRKFCVRDTKNVSDFVQKHFVSAANVSQFAQPKKHHGQQSVRHNVSSFARVFSQTRAITHFLYYLCTSQIEALTPPPRATPRAFEFLENFWKIPPSPGRKAVQMPPSSENYQITVLIFQTPLHATNQFFKDD